jgi:hypothetical protein
MIAERVPLPLPLPLALAEILGRTHATVTVDEVPTIVQLTDEIATLLDARGQMSRARFLAAVADGMTLPLPPGI